MAFKSALKVRSDSNGWTLLEPLTWELGIYKVTVPEGFVTDLASIPKALRWLISNDDPRIRKPAVIHDYLCRFGTIPRTQADWMFYLALRECGVSRLKAALMFGAVWLYSVTVARAAKA